jgi:hypothetical protein
MFYYRDVCNVVDTSNFYLDSDLQNFLYLDTHRYRYSDTDRNFDTDSVDMYSNLTHTIQKFPSNCKQSCYVFSTTNKSFVRAKTRASSHLNIWFAMLYQSVSLYEYRIYQNRSDSIGYRFGFVELDALLHKTFCYRDALSRRYGTVFCIFRGTCCTVCTVRLTESPWHSCLVSGQYIVLSWGSLLFGETLHWQVRHMEPDRPRWSRRVFHNLSQQSPFTRSMTDTCNR